MYGNTSSLLLADLVFIQNGMLQPWLDARGLGDNTQVCHLLATELACLGMHAQLRNSKTCILSMLREPMSAKHQHSTSLLPLTSCRSQLI